MAKIISRESGPFFSMSQEDLAKQLAWKALAQIESLEKRVKALETKVVQLESKTKP